VQALTILRSKSVTHYASVIVPGASYVTGHDMLTIIHLLNDVPNFFVMLNVGLNAVALDKASKDTFLIFPDAWKTPGEVKEYWQLGANVLGVRNVPVFDTNLTLAYIPYIQVSNLDDPLAIRDEYTYALTELLLAFLQIRLSKLDLAKLSVEKWARECDDASRRIVRYRD
jgi:hypothetical protein